MNAKVKKLESDFEKGQAAYYSYKNQISFFISNNFNHYSCSEISQGVKKVMIELRFVKKSLLIQNIDRVQKTDSWSNHESTIHACTR